jgi:hypothetical protein
MTICAACAPPGGGRNPVTPRFVRHFSMFCIPSPSELNLKHMFNVSIILLMPILMDVLPRIIMKYAKGLQIHEKTLQQAVYILLNHA